MDAQSLLTADRLRARARAAAGRHLVLPAASRPLPGCSPAEADAISRRALDTILTRPFRVGPLPTESVYAGLLERVDRRLIDSYTASISDLIEALGYQGLFLPTMRQSAFSWLLNFGFYQIASRRVRRWEADPANREKLAQMNSSARRNLSVPSSLGASEADQCVIDAAHRYRVYWEALQLSGLTKSRRRIIGMYLDGTQHHIPQTVALHLTTLDKGQVTQPWQGEGMLLDNGHGKLEPFVMTAGRRPRYQTHVIDGLDSVPLPGFDQISVAVAADK